MYDLHTHSYYSDGELSPDALLSHAAARGVTCLALTDHDTVDGLIEAQTAAKAQGLSFVNGAEISVTWNDKTIHIVGLSINPMEPNLQAGLLHHQQLRDMRAQAIGERLAAIGIPGAHEGAAKYAKHGVITRPHFAHYLVEQGVVKDMAAAFKHYLGKDKPGFVPLVWAALEEGVQWILQAGGVAIIAHPLRYRLSKSKLRRLIQDFKNAGGHGIEVVTSRHDPAGQQRAEQLCREFDLYAGAGSDFHGPSTWANLGGLAPIAEDCRAIWEHPQWNEIR